MKFFRLHLFFLLIGLLLAAAPIQAGTGVGIPVFENQRFSTRDNWLGFFLKDRVQEYLRVNSSCHFYSDRTLSLWEDQWLDKILKDKKGILITGSYVKVFNRLKVNIRFQKDQDSFHWQDAFLLSELNSSVDRLSKKLLEKFSCAKKHPRSISYPVLDRYTEALYGLKQNRIANNSLADINQLLDFYEQEGVREDPLAVEEFVIQALSGISAYNEAERRELLKLARLALTRTGRKLPRHDGLKSLMALVFYFQKTPGVWVENTAGKALRLNSLNETARFALSLGKGASTGGGKTVLVKLNKWNSEVLKQRPVEWQDAAYDKLFIDYENKAPEKSADAEYAEQFQAARQMLVESKKEEAVELLDQLISRYPEKEEAILLQANILSKDHAYMKALELLKEKLRFFQQSKAVQTAVGTNYYYLKNYPQAENHLKNALDIQQDYEPAQKRMVLVLLKKKELDQALEYVDVMLKQNPQDAQNWYQKGLVYWHLKDYKKTLESWEKSYQLAPERKQLKQWIARVKKKIQSEK